MSKKPLPDGAGFGGSFGDLLKAKGLAPTSQGAPVAPVAPAATTTADPLDLRSAGKLVVRRENKGRGGKTVTLVSGLPSEHLEAIARALKTALGCGATVEDASVAVQGDQTARVVAWLGDRGARQVVRGN